jgi:hypothetical protein
MYSGEYDACDVTLSVYPHRASLKNMPDHGGNRTYDLWNTSLVLCFVTLLLHVTPSICLYIQHKFSISSSAAILKQQFLKASLQDYFTSHSVYKMARS